jgi:hypothetical protein
VTYFRFLEGFFIDASAPFSCRCARLYLDWPITQAGSRMSALNQSSDGCDWKSCHIMSSFQEEGITPSVVSLTLLFRRSGPPLKDKDGGNVASCAVNPAPSDCVCSFELDIGTSGLHNPKSVSHSRCSRWTYLFSLTRVEMPSVTSWRSWKSRALEVPTTLQKTTKKGHSGYESIVLYL